MKLGINVKYKPDTYITFPQKDFPFFWGGGRLLQKEWQFGYHVT